MVTHRQTLETSDLTQRLLPLLSARCRCGRRNVFLQFRTVLDAVSKLEAVVAVSGDLGSLGDLARVGPLAVRTVVHVVSRCQAVVTGHRCLILRTILDVVTGHVAVVTHDSLLIVGCRSCRGCLVAAADAALRSCASCRSVGRRLALGLGTIVNVVTFLVAVVTSDLELFSQGIGAILDVVSRHVAVEADHDGRLGLGPGVTGQSALLDVLLGAVEPVLLTLRRLAKLAELANHLFLLLIVDITAFAQPLLDTFPEVISCQPWTLANGMTALRAIAANDGGLLSLAPQKLIHTAASSFLSPFFLVFFAFSLDSLLVQPLLLLPRRFEVKHVMMSRLATGNSANFLRGAIRFLVADSQAQRANVVLLLLDKVPSFGHVHRGKGLALGRDVTLGTAGETSARLLLFLGHRALGGHPQIVLTVQERMVQLQAAVDQTRHDLLARFMLRLTQTTLAHFWRSLDQLDFVVKLHADKHGTVGVRVVHVAAAARSAVLDFLAERRGFDPVQEDVMVEAAALHATPLGRFAANDRVTRVQALETKVGKSFQQLDSFGQSATGKLLAIAKVVVFGRTATNAVLARYVGFLGEMQQVIVWLGATFVTALGRGRVARTHEFGVF